MSKQAAFPRIRAAVLRELGKSSEPAQYTDATITVVVVVVVAASFIVTLVVLASAWVTGDWGL